MLNSFEYDDNGNRTVYRQGDSTTGVVLHSYSYDAKDRLATLSIPGSGAFNFLTTRETTELPNKALPASSRYYLEGEHLEATYDGNDVLRNKYLRGVVVDEVINGYEYDSVGGEINLNFHHDHIRSVVGVSTHSR